MRSISYYARVKTTNVGGNTAAVQITEYITLPSGTYYLANAITRYYSDSGSYSGLIRVTYNGSQWVCERRIPLAADGGATSMTSLSWSWNTWADHTFTL